MICSFKDGKQSIIIIVLCPTEKKKKNNVLEKSEKKEVGYEKEDLNKPNMAQHKIWVKLINSWSQNAKWKQTKICNFEAKEARKDYDNRKTMWSMTTCAFTTENNEKKIQYLKQSIAFCEKNNV